MAVRKQTGKRLQRVRAFPNFIDWSWRTPEELRQKLGRFEKSLRGMFGDLGDLLLKVVDGNRSPDYTHEGVDTVRFVGTGVSLAKTREGYVTVTITDTNTVVDDHGALSGLADDDHTQYLLVDGTRALGGNWSLGDNQLSNADAIAFNGIGSAITALDSLTMQAASSTIDMSGGDITTVDDIIMQGAASQITMANGQIVNCDTMTFNGDLSVLSGLDQLTLHDSGSFVDGNNGQLRDFSRLDRTTGVLAIEAEGGDVTVDASDDIFLRSNDALVGQPGGTFQVTAGGAITLFNSGVSNNISLITGAEINLSPNTRVDFSNKPAERVAHVQINDGDSMSGQPDAGTVEIGSYSGPDSSDPGGMLSVFSRYFLWQFPVAVESGSGLSGGNNLTSNIDFSSVRGYDLTDRVIRLRVHFQSMRTDGDDSDYGTQDQEEEFTINTNVSGDCNVSKRAMRGYIVGSAPVEEVGVYSASAARVSDINLAGNISVVATGNTTVTITGTVDGAGTRRAIMAVEIKFCHI